MTDTGCDVMICNSNPFATQHLEQSLRAVNAHRELILTWTETGANSNASLLNVRQELLVGQLGLYQHIGRASASKLSHDQENFVLSCHVHFLDGVLERKVPCSQSPMKVQKIVNKEYFNCFKFYGGNETGTRPSIGMSLLLYVDDPRDSDRGENLTLGKMNKGALLTLGERDAFLDPDSNGIEIMPGLENVVRLQQSRRERLTAPYGNCKDREAREDSADENYTLPYLYTRETCFSACIEHQIIQDCACHDLAQSGTLTSTFKNVSSCGSTEDGKEKLVERMQCAQHWRSRQRQMCLGGCAVPCSETSLSHQLSYLRLSPQEVRRTLTQERHTVPGNSNNSEVLSRLVAGDLDVANVALVRLRRQPHTFYKMEDLSAMTMTDLLAKIGGTCNLLSGISVFVFVEILDLLCRLCQQKCNSRRADQKASSVEGTNL